MTVLKGYVQGVGWADIIAGTIGPPGPPGEPGIEIGSVPPTDTDMLWADTGDTGITAVETASVAETIAGTIINKAVTPAGLAGASTVFDVRAYGAKGDGVTDDTAAIQNAINACSADSGGIVFIPNGRHVISATLSIPSYVSLRGVRGAFRSARSGIHPPTAHRAI